MFHDKKVILMGLGLYGKGSGISAAKFFIGKCRELVITDLKTARELKKQMKEIEMSLRQTIQQLSSPRKRGSSNQRNLAKRLDSRFRGNDRGNGLFKTKITWHLGGHRVSDFRTADIVFQNPSVPADSPYLKIARQRGIPIVNDWSIFLSACSRLSPPLEGGDERGGKKVRQTTPYPLLRKEGTNQLAPKIFVGITGTRGKSTTTALIYEMLKKKYKKVMLAGNLGVSPLNFIDSYRGEPIVAELSSWLLHHFPAVKKSPNIAVVTNIMKDHLDKYRNMKEYIADKENIFRFQKSGDFLILNWDNQYTREMRGYFSCHSERSEESRTIKERDPSSPPRSVGGAPQDDKRRVIWFSLKKHLPKWVPFSAVRLVGRHNLANALAAAAAAEAAGVPRRDIVSVLQNFRGLPNRLELIRTFGGVKYYNDTTATTPEATMAALTALGSAPVIPSASSRQALRAKPEGSRPSKERDSSPAAQNDIAKNIILICGGADKKLEYKELAKYIKRYCKAVVLFKGEASEKIYNLISQFPNFPISYPIKGMAEILRQVRNHAVKGDIILLSPAAASFGLFKNEFDRGEEFRKIVNDLTK